MALASGQNADLPEEILLAIERRSELEQAMQSLPERCRRLLTLLYCIGTSLLLCGSGGTASNSAGKHWPGTRPQFEAPAKNSWKPTGF